nr:MAG TPA: hypothetical protein [Caudoviricetes sp.]DAW60149.1 MAG TPA: hypothetical protein [Caudoviricetes sp.]
MVFPSSHLFSFVFILSNSSSLRKYKKLWAL